MTIQELDARFTRTRDSYGHGTSHYPTRWAGELDGLSVGALFTNGAQRYIRLSAQVAGYSDPERTRWGCKTHWTIVYITPEEMAELIPASRGWLAQATAACESDVFSDRPLVHPDLLATE